MARAIRIPLLLLAGLLAGCSPDPLAGTYSGPLSEAIRIDDDGGVLWQPPKADSSSLDEFRFVGILSDPDSAGRRYLILPSSSPYMGTKLSVLDGGKLLDVDWDSWGKNGSSDSRSVRYTKRQSEQGATGQPATPPQVGD